MKYFFNILFVLVNMTSNAQEVVSFNLSDCDSDSFVDLIRRRIVSKKVENDTLNLRIGFNENCCIEPKPVIRKSNDTLFLNIENTSNTYCACDCCYEMELKIANVDDTNFVLIWDGYKVNTQSKYPKLPHEYNIDSNTPTNRFNKDNIKVGLWIEQKESGRKYEIYYYEEPTNKEIVKWVRQYNNDGELQEVTIYFGKSNNTIILSAYEYNRYFVK